MGRRQSRPQQQNIQHLVLEANASKSSLLWIAPLRDSFNFNINSWSSAPKSYDSNRRRKQATAKVSTSLTKSQAAKLVFNRVQTNRAKQKKLKRPMTANVRLLLELPSSAHIQKEKMLCATHSATETPLISHGPLKRPVSRIRFGQLHVDRVRTGKEITHYRTSSSHTFFPKLNEMSRFATLDLCL